MSGSCGTIQGYRSGHKIGGLVCDACWLAYCHFMAQKKPREHGTDIGHVQHILNHELSCESCKKGYEKKLKKTLTKESWRILADIWESYTTFTDTWTI